MRSAVFRRHHIIDIGSLKSLLEELNKGSLKTGNRFSGCFFRRHFILLLVAPSVSNPPNAYFLHLQAYAISNGDVLCLCLPINRAGLPSRRREHIPRLHAACKQKCRKMVWGQQTKCRHISLLRLLHLPVALFSRAHYRRFHTRQDYWFANRPADFLLFDPWSSPNLGLQIGHRCPTKHSKPLSSGINADLHSYKRQNGFCALPRRWIFSGCLWVLRRHSRRPRRSGMDARRFFVSYFVGHECPTYGAWLQLSGSLKPPFIPA